MVSLLSGLDGNDGRYNSWLPSCPNTTCTLPLAASMQVLSWLQAVLVLLEPMGSTEAQGDCGVVLHCCLGAFL